MVNDVDEDDETGELSTLIVCVDAARFQAIRSGAIAFRDTFTEAPNGTMCLATTSYKGATGSRTHLRPFWAEHLTSRWLPMAGARLSASSPL